MKIARHLRALGTVTSFAVVLSCGPESVSTAPEVRSPSELRVLHVLPDTPPLATTQTRFYAVKGRSAALDLYFHAAPGQVDSLKFLEFRIGSTSLDRRPDGSAIADGDSVLITLTVTDPSHLVVDFQPSGLLFAPNDKPTLRLYYTACGDDLNYDGRVDAGDVAIQSQLAIWRQEVPGQPWLKMGSVQISNLKELDAELPGFTGYAAAY